MSSGRVAAFIVLGYLSWSGDYCCSGFAGGFGKPSGNKKNANRNKANKAASGTVRQQQIDLGGAHKVSIYVPPDRLEEQLMSSKGKKNKKKAAKVNRSEVLESFGSFYGTGDVIWPSALRLSRLLANCPSFVNGRRVMELGCGLGLASAAAILGGPKSLTLSDVDDSVLDLALKTCTETAQRTEAPVNVDRCQFDWYDRSTWPAEKEGAMDLVFASDILYAEEAVGPLAQVLAFLLVGGTKADNGGNDDVVARALIVDPANRLHRDAFVSQCAKCGLEAEPVPFPGEATDFVLINVTPS